VTDEQHSWLWAFARGDAPGAEFERWFLDQEGLEAALGDELHWELQSGDYRDKDTVWLMRKALREALAAQASCECLATRDVTAVAMGSDEARTVFETLDRVVTYGPEKWWLYLSKCRTCGTIWLIAQDERIYDEFYLARTDEAALTDALSGKWPDRFRTYESVLAIGRELNHPPQFLDPMSNALLATIEDLFEERPGISVREIGHLLGLTDEHAAALVNMVRKRTG